MTSFVPGGLFAAALGLTGVVVFQLLAPVSDIPDPPAASLPARPGVVLLADLRARRRCPGRRQHPARRFRQRLAGGADHQRSCRAACRRS